MDGPAARAGHAVRAAKLAGAALELRSAVGHPASPGAGARLEEVLKPARTSLGDPRASALLAEGRAMTADEAVSYAIRPPAATAEDAASALPGDMVPRPRVGNGSAAAAPAAMLTRREWEIAGLIARGLSNRDIARELVISQATVARHVANILGKLGFSSRAQVAAWMARQPGPES